MSARSLKVKSLPCIACKLYGVYYQPFPTQEHHLNFDGKAGQKRRGDEFSIPLCEWHHVGRTDNRFSQKAATALYGPSLKLQSRAFRTAFGSDDELLERTNTLLERAA